MKKRKSNTINVNKVIFVVLIISFFAISIKVSFVALAEKTDGLNLSEFVQNRNTQRDILKAKRGSILSSDGELLAHSINSYTVIAILKPYGKETSENANYVVDKNMTAEKLSAVLGMPYDDIMTLLNRDVSQVELGPYGRGITELTKKQIEALGLPGIDFIETSKRFYDMGTFASYIIGYAQNDDNNNIVGKMGVEAYYDDVLQGEDGYTEYQKDAQGYTIPFTDPITVKEKNGSDIYLTIDSKIQLYVENAVKDIAQYGNLDWMTFSVMDAKTGAIVATSSNPTFNPNKLVISNYLNPLTSYVYEPGSTMKIFSFLAAMEDGIYDGSELYQSGTIQVDDATIKDFNGRGWGQISFDTGFAYSSNTAATNLALRLGREKLYTFYDSLGFGQKTGITLPSEYSGNIDFTYKTELATASFGQGVTTTPIQNLQALTILTNDGVMIQPYIVDKIVNSDTGEVEYQHERTELGQKISSNNADKMLALMYDVVQSNMTDAKYFQTDSVTVVGKTGTAQYAGEDGKYVIGKNSYIRSFAGVFPYENPQYIIYISVKAFDGNFKDFAGTITKVIDEIATYKNLSSLIGNMDKNKIITLDNYINNDVTTVEEKLKGKDLTIVKLGNGKYVMKQYPEKGSVVVAGNKLFLVTANSDYVMPDITNWSMSEVKVLCKFLNIKCSFTGNGHVETFSIPVDTPITNDLILEVTLK